MTAIAPHLVPLDWWTWLGPMCAWVLLMGLAVLAIYGWHRFQRELKGGD